MISRKLFLFFGLLFLLFGVKTIQAQIEVVLNEYCATNSGLLNPQTDNFGDRSDWVEIYNPQSFAVPLTGYYLSNDRFNLFKWQFPSGTILGANQYKTIWLSGKNVAVGTNLHANFTLEQCKGQWLILTTPQGVVRDSVFIQRTKEGHTRGRVDPSNIGRDAWRVFTVSSYGSANLPPSYVDYAPKPIIQHIIEPSGPNTAVNTGSFIPNPPDQRIKIALEKGVGYDSTQSCFYVYYTLDNGDYPVPGNLGTFQLFPLDSTGVFIFQPATIVRAIAVPKPNVGNPPNCSVDYLPSFCETNTYFTDQAYNDFSPNFGVISIAMDANWLTTSGANSPTIHVEYYDNKTQVSEGYASITRPVNEAWLTQQRGFYITIDDRKGFGCNFEGKIFNLDTLGASERKVFPTLHLKAGDFESHSAPGSVGGLPSSGTGIMDVFYQSLAAKNNLHVSSLHIKPVIAFINGKYQGVYDLREVYDKHYENYYNQQSKDSLDLLFYHNGDGAVTYADGPSSNFSGLGSFANSVYTLGISPTVNSIVNYNLLFSRLDKESFIDYMILNSYAMNSNLWNYNVAFAKGGQVAKPGNKWHYYLWNMPAIFNFTTLSINGITYNNPNVSPCYLHNASAFYPVTPLNGNGHGNILRNLMQPTPANPSFGRYLFQTDYKNRYQDLLNGPLKCENILKHYDYVTKLFLKEMRYQQDVASAPFPSPFLMPIADSWDTNTVRARWRIEGRCKIMSDAFGTVFGGSCYGMQGPYPIAVDVQPPGAGIVQLNSITLDNYVWSGNYYATTLAFKAIATSTLYSFHHWEFKNNSTPLNNAPLSLDSLKIGFNKAEEVIAVFTDKTSDITMPTGFTPNGDGINDVFIPNGSALYARDFEMSVWNRWGQQVYRSVEPTEGWNGMYNGELAQTGVYAYLITYKNIYNESKIVKGNLTLLR